MTRPSTRVMAFAAFGLLAATTLGACGDSTETVPATPSVAMSALTEPTVEATEDIMVGQDPATWSPVIVKEKKKKIELIPTQIAVFPDFEYSKKTGYVAVSSDPAIIEILPAGNGTAVGFRALGPGTAVVKVYDGPVDAKGKVIRKVKITVNP
ncbi:MAG: hypothetical protein HQ453_04025 [Actinobacteria bacterium]|nr:hypothetical protein [Actinomycetota bacterium]